MLNKIKKIKELRLSSADKFLFKIIFNLKEVQTFSQMVKYYYRKKLIFEYDMDRNVMYMSYNTFDEFERLFTKNYTTINLDAKTYLLEKLYEHFTYDVVKRDSYEVEYNSIMIIDGKMQRNPLFNSVSGKCKEISLLAPILVDDDV